MKQKSVTGKKETVILERRFVPEGELIIKEGEVGDAAFLIQSGMVSIFTEKNGKHIELDRAGVGQIVGEMALMFDTPRTASVQALEDCNLIVITRRTLKQKLEGSDPTIRAIVPMLMKRVMKTNNALLNQSTDVDDLIKAVNMIYENVYSSMNEAQQAAFASVVFPMLESFLKSVKSFQVEHSDNQEKT